MADFRVKANPVEKQNTYLLEVSGWIDISSALQWEKTMLAYAVTGKECLILDFGRLNYINSRGLSALLNLHKQLDSRAGHLIIVNIGDRVNKSIEISGISQLIPVYDSLEAALAQDEVLQAR